MSTCSPTPRHVDGDGVGMCNIMYLNENQEMDSDYSITITFTGEDHTLGNALRYVLMRKYVMMVVVAYRHL